MARRKRGGRRGGGGGRPRKVHKPYMCTTCGMTFAVMFELQEHLEHNHGIVQPPHKKIPQPPGAMHHTPVSSSQPPMIVKVRMTNNFKPTLNMPDLENRASALESPSQTTSQRIGLRYDDLLFHNDCGLCVSITFGGRTAFRPNYLKDYNNAVVLTNRPLKVGEIFEVLLLQVVMKWAGSIEIGVTIHSAEELEFPSTMTNVRSGTWILAGNVIKNNGTTVSDKYGSNKLNKLTAGDNIGLVVYDDGKLHFFVNGIDQGLAASNVPNNVYGVINLYGQASKATIVGSTGYNQQMAPPGMYGNKMHQNMMGSSHMPPYSPSSHYPQGGYHRAPGSLQMHSGYSQGQSQNSAYPGPRVPPPNYVAPPSGSGYNSQQPYPGSTGTAGGYSSGGMMPPPNQYLKAPASMPPPAAAAGAQAAAQAAVIAAAAFSGLPSTTVSQSISSPVPSTVTVSSPSDMMQSPRNSLGPGPPIMDEDDEKLREEMKDLINDDEEEEENNNSDSDDEVGRKKKRRHEDYDDGLEDEDYDLLEENLGVKVQRKKKFKRLRRIEDEESDEEGAGAEGDDRDAIANELFDGDEGEGDDEAVRDTAEDTQMGTLEESEGESDESDFIVDDDGQPIGGKGKKKKHIKYNDAALQEAQEIFGVDFDYADFAQEGDEYEDEEIEEEYEDEDEDEEGGEDRPKKKKTARKRAAKKSIFDVFEPVELERSHLTDRDNKIRSKDEPERFQLRRIPVTEVKDEEEFEAESEWIYKQAFSISTISIQEGEHSGTGHQPIAGRKNPSAVGKIREALKFIRNQNFEVPFIAFYRKEYVEPDLNINDLWTVYRWDEKWCQLKARKDYLEKLFKKMQLYQGDVISADPEKPLPDGWRTLEHSDICRMQKAQTFEEVQDCYAHFMLYYGHDVPAMKEYLRKKELKEKELGEVPSEETETKIKHVAHKDSYIVCKESGLDGLASKFGLTPEQFGENLRDNYQRHEVDQYPVEPKEVASDFICRRFATVDDCLAAAKFMVATQISREPAVRKCVRQVYFERAKLSVKPTKKGLKEIDEYHPCYSMKYLKNKPVKDLRGDQFLKLHMAERDGFLTITVILDKQDERDDRHAYLEEIKQLYERDEFSKNVQEWNDQRIQALETALIKILYPTFEKELKLKLLNEANERIIKACCRKLYNWLKVAPYIVGPQIEEEDDFDTREGVRVLSIAYTTDREVPAFCAMMDGDGEVLEYLRLPFLLTRRNAWKEKDRQLKEKDMDSLKDLILTKKPHVVTVAAESRDALMIVEDVKGVINDLVDSEGFPPINVELVENELGLLYANSKKGETDFRDYPTLLRQAISLARRLQDPLMEFSQLCTPDEDILCLKYHPLQGEMNKDELLHALYLEFVNRTNEVGVDFNKAIQFNHTANIVQFICGLGPRKGTYLVKTLKTANQQLESRTQLITFCKMGPKVFINCAGFIKIDTASLVDSTETYVEVLDGSRVHPEAYEWARKMAVDALEYDDTSDDFNPAGALEEILKNPETLKDLDLDAFAEELERRGFGNKSITLYDIRAELNHKYKDLRTSYRPPNAEEVFNMLTKEIPETFYIGKLVLVFVNGIARRKPKADLLENANPIRNDDTGLWQCPFCLKRDFLELSDDVWGHFDDASCPGQAMGVWVRLDNSISGFIPTKMISDKHVTNPEDRVKIGMALYARITKIDIERFAVDLTSRSSDLCDKNNEWRPPKDLYYDHVAEDKDHKIADDTAKKANRQGQKFWINDPPCDF